MADTMTTKHESFHQSTSWLVPTVKSIMKFIFHLGFDFFKAKKILDTFERDSEFTEWFLLF